MHQWAVCAGVFARAEPRISGTDTDRMWSFFVVFFFYFVLRSVAICHGDILVLICSYDAVSVQHVYNVRITTRAIVYPGN